MFLSKCICVYTCIVVEPAPVRKACSPWTSLPSFPPNRNLLQQYYPLDSTAPPTDAQLSDINANKPDNLPTEACCTAVKAFDDGECACDASIPPLLGTLGLSATSTGLQGVSGISGKLCDFTPHTC